MEVFLVYLWLKLDSLRALLLGLSAFCMFCLLIYGMAKSEIYNEVFKSQFKKSWWPWARRAFISAITFCIIACLVPSSKETAILVGTSYAVDLAKSPEGVKVGSLIRKKANEYLDEELKSVSQPVAKPQ